MFDWLKKLVPAQPASEPPPSEVEALENLRAVASDVVIEAAWEAMDFHAGTIRNEVYRLVKEDLLGAYPRHAAIIWLAYQDGNNERMMDSLLQANIQDSIEWAFPFEENNVLTGGVLGALDGLPAAEKEAMALRVFTNLQEVTARRFWLLLKVRTDPFVAAVAEAISGGYKEEDRPKMAGAFRQFQEEDIDVLLRHHSLESAGADLFVEAIASTESERGHAALKEAAEDSRPQVRKYALLGLSKLDASQ